MKIGLILRFQPKEVPLIEGPAFEIDGEFGPEVSDHTGKPPFPDPFPDNGRNLLSAGIEVWETHRKLIFRRVISPVSIESHHNPVGNGHTPFLDEVSADLPRHIAIKACDNQGKDAKRSA